jgi:hypothetical protein
LSSPLSSSVRVSIMWMSAEIFVTCLDESWTHHFCLRLANLFFTKNNKEFTSGTIFSWDWSTFCPTRIYMCMCLHLAWLNDSIVWMFSFWLLSIHLATWCHTSNIEPYLLLFIPKIHTRCKMAD